MLTFNHFNFNVLDMQRSLAFYKEALGLTPLREKRAADGSYWIVFLQDEAGSPFALELTELRDRTGEQDPEIRDGLQQLIPDSGKVVTVPRSTLNRRVVQICTAAGLPPCSPHDLRRSYASLGYHLKWSERTIMVLGGWSNIETVHKIYVKLAQKDVNADVQAMRDYYGFTTG